MIVTAYSGTCNHGSWNVLQHNSGKWLYITTELITCLRCIESFCMLLRKMIVTITCNPVHGVLKHFVTLFLEMIKINGTCNLCTMILNDRTFNSGNHWTGSLIHWSRDYVVRSKLNLDRLLDLVHESTFILGSRTALFLDCKRFRLGITTEWKIKINI